MSTPPKMGKVLRNGDIVIASRWGLAAEEKDSVIALCWNPRKQYFCTWELVNPGHGWIARKGRTFELDFQTALENMNDQGMGRYGDEAASEPKGIGLAQLMDMTYAEMTVPELRLLAKARGLSDCSDMERPDIIHLLKYGRSTPETEEKIRQFARRIIANDGPGTIFKNAPVNATSAIIEATGALTFGDVAATGLHEKAAEIIREEARRTLEFLGQPIPETGE